MRTTLVLSDSAYELARSIAHAERRSLGDVISDLILHPKQASGRLNSPNELGIRTFNSREPLTTDRVGEILDDE